VKEGPVIDGKEDPVWKKMEAASFAEGTVPTSVRVMADKEKMYIFIVCEEPFMNRLKCASVKHDGEVWNDDSIEVFIDTRYDRTSYFHFIVNAAGVGLDGKWGPMAQKTEWNGQWEKAVSRDTGSWQVELAIPFSTLEFVPVDGYVCGFNVTRNRFAGAVVERASLNPLPGNRFHQPEAFGNIVFGSYKNSALNYCRQTETKLSVTTGKAAGILKQNKSLSGKYSGQIKNLSDALARETSDIEKTKAIDAGRWKTSLERCNELLNKGGDLLKNMEIDALFGTD